MRDFTLERDESDESESTESDGKLQLSDFLSRPAEWHAAGLGLYRGFTGMSPRPKHPDSKAEKPYFGVFYVIGWIVKAILAVILAVLGAGAFL